MGWPSKLIGLVILFIRIVSWERRAPGNKKVRKDNMRNVLVLLERSRVIRVVLRVSGFSFVWLKYLDANLYEWFNI
jgi:hypothetical protein